MISIFEEYGWDWSYHAYRESSIWERGLVRAIKSIFRTVMIVFIGFAGFVGSVLWLQLGHSSPIGWGNAALHGGIAGALLANAVRVLW